jgi:hypothetical protein
VRSPMSGPYGRNRVTAAGKVDAVARNG